MPPLIWRDQICPVHSELFRLPSSGLCGYLMMCCGESGDIFCVRRAARGGDGCGEPTGSTGCLCPCLAVTSLHPHHSQFFSVVWSEGQGRLLCSICLLHGGLSAADFHQELQMRSTSLPERAATGWGRSRDQALCCRVRLGGAFRSH